MNRLGLITKRTIAGIIAFLMILTSYPDAGNIIYAAEPGEVIEDIEDIETAETAITESDADESVSDDFYIESDPDVSDEMYEYGSDEASDESSDETQITDMDPELTDAYLEAYGGSVIEHPERVEIQGGKGVASLDFDELDPSGNAVRSGSLDWSDNPEAKNKYEINVECGNRVRISNISLSSDHYFIMNELDEDDSFVSKEIGDPDKPGKYSGHPFKISVKTRTYATSRIVLSGSKGTITPDPDCYTEKSGEKYVKSSTGFKFKIASKDGEQPFAIKKVTYKIGSKGQTKELHPGVYYYTGDDENDRRGGGLYTIPAEVILEAILADESDEPIGEQIILTVTTAQPKQNVTIKANENIEQITYVEYSLAYYDDGEEAYIYEDDKPDKYDVMKEIDMNQAKSEYGYSFTIGSCHGLFIYAAEAEDKLLTADSVKCNGKTVPAIDGPDTKCYEIKSVEAESAISFTAYSMAGITVNEALTTDDTPATITKTTLEGVTAPDPENHIYTKFENSDERPFFKVDPIEIHVQNADGFAPNEVKINAPTAFYKTADGSEHRLTVETITETKEIHGQLVTSLIGYRIPSNEVIEAIEAGGQIIINTRAELIPMTSVRLRLDKDSPITSIDIVPSTGRSDKSNTVTVNSFTEEGDYKFSAPVLVPESTMLIANNIKWDSSVKYDGQPAKDVCFVRVTDISDPANPVRIQRSTLADNSWYINTGSDDSLISFETAVLAGNDIGYVEIKDASVKSNSSFRQANNTTTYIKNSKYGYSFYILVDQNDEPKKMGARTVTCQIPGEPDHTLYPVSSDSKVDDAHGFTIPYAVLTDAAFSSPEEGTKKLTIKADIKQSGFLKQKLYIPDPDNARVQLSVKSGTREYSASYYPDSEEPNDSFSEYSFSYGEVLSIKAEPQPGVKLTAGYLLPVSEKDAIDADTSIAPENRRAAYLSSTKAQKYNVQANGSITIPVSKLTDSFYMLFEEDDIAPEEVLVVTEAVKSDGKYYPGMIIAASEDGSFDLKADRYYTVEYRKGSLSCYLNNPKAELTPEGVEPVLLNSVIKDESVTGKANSLVIYTNSNDTAGMSFSLSFGVDWTDKNAVFNVLGIISSDSIRFDPDDLSSGKIVAYYGGEKTYTVTLDGTSDDDFDVVIYAEQKSKLSGLISRVSLTDYAWIRHKAGKTDDDKDCTIMTIGSHAKLYDLITKHDENYYDLNVYAGFCSKEDGTEFMRKEIKFNAAIPETRGTFAPIPDYNSFTFDLANYVEFNYPVENAEGLYFVLSASSAQDTYPLLKNKKILIKAPADKLTLNLSDSTNAYRTEPVIYDLRLYIVQIIPGKEDEFLTSDDPFELALEFYDAFGMDDAETVAKTPEAFADEENEITANTYATKLTLSKTAGAKKIKKIYTGMDAFAYVNVGYTAGKKNTPSVKKLEKAELVTQKGGKVVASTMLDSGVSILNDDGTDKAIVIDPSLIPAGKYNLIAYAKEPGSKEITAKTSVTILQGIEQLTVTTPTDSLYKASRKEAKLTASLSYGKKKPAAKKVKWYLVNPEYDPGNGVPRDEDLFTDLNKKQISIKNGTVKIDKNVVISEDMEFAIAAVPSDYTHSAANNGIGVSDVIRITGYSAAPAHIYVYSLKEKDNFYELFDGATYTTAQLDLGVVITEWPFDPDELLDQSAASIEDNAKLEFSKCYMVRDDFGNIMKNISIKGDGFKIKNGCISCSAPKKNASLTVSTTDGSGKSLKIKFNVVSSKNPVFALLSGASGRSFYSAIGEMSTGSMSQIDIINGKAVNNNTGSLYFMTTTSDYCAVGETVKVTGGKIKNSKTAQTGIGAIYEITPTARQTVITHTDKATGKTSVIKVENTLIAKSKAKTKVSATNYYDGTNGKQKNNKGKIFNSLVFTDKEDYESAGACNRVTYKVLNGKKKYAAKTRVRICVTKDRIQKEPSKHGYVEKKLLEEVLRFNAIKGNGLMLDENGGLYATLDKNSSFTIDYDMNGQLDIPAGKYTLSITPVDDNGYALAKSASVTVNAVSVPKAKIKLKTTKLTKFGTEKQIVFKTLSNVVYNGRIPDAKCGIAEVNLLGVNNAGRINRFANRFKLSTDADNRSFLSRNDIPLTKEDGYTGKKGKESISGWIAVTARKVNGEYYTQYFKVTVSGVTSDER